MTPLGKQRARETRERFASMVEGATVESVNLADAALLIAAEEETHLDVARYLSLLDEWGEQACARFADAGSKTVEVFNEFIFDEMGFTGNQINYYDPHNSFLNHVMTRRVGIPITLSIVYMEVGRRAGLLTEGIGLPGHFIVRVRAFDGAEAIFIDSFHGRTLDADDCQDLLDTVYGGQMALSEEHLRPATKKEILVRLLTNLKAIYARANLHRQALAAVERILLLAPESSAERRDRSVLLAHLERLDEAINETRAYLRSRPKPPDSEQVREHLYMLQKRRAMLN
jgi:regulator of sirC expression with transglutaminase-like and TPR domain